MFSHISTGNNGQPLVIKQKSRLNQKINCSGRTRKIQETRETINTDISMTFHRNCKITGENNLPVAGLYCGYRRQS